MNVLMVQSELKQEHAADAEAGVQKLFAAIEERQLEGIRYASCRVGDGPTYMAVLEIEDGVENPLPALPEFLEFQANLKNWLAGPPAVEQLTVLGSYRLF